MALKYTDRAHRFVDEHHDKCSLCNRKFVEPETTHLGYTSRNRLAYVGNCCSKLLIQTIVRHRYAKRLFEKPDKNTVIWRFMDFTKFVWLLSSEGLYFSRADQFEDPFEGAKGLKKDKREWDQFYLDFFEQGYKNPPKGVDFKKTDAEIRKEAKRLLSELYIGSAHSLKRTFINCWHENPFESEAMWKLYTKNMAEGVAIQTTYQRLCKSLNKSRSVAIGRVNYIDYNKRFVGVNGPFWFKRSSFEHEHEVRAIFEDFTDNDVTGKSIKIDINILIQNIYVSPTASNWFIELVKEILVRYGVKKRIKSSSLLIEPFH